MEVYKLSREYCTSPWHARLERVTTLQLREAAFLCDQAERFGHKGLMAARRAALAASPAEDGPRNPFAVGQIVARLLGRPPLLCDESGREQRGALRLASLFPGPFPVDVVGVSPHDLAQVAPRARAWHDFSDWSGDLRREIAPLPAPTPRVEPAPLKSEWGNRFRTSAPEVSDLTLEVLNAPPGLTILELPGRGVGGMLGVRHGWGRWSYDKPLVNLLDYQHAGLEPHSLPFRAPHHTASLRALTGDKTMVGELDLAAGGLIVLDEIGEFSRAALDIVRRWVDGWAIGLSYSPSETARAIARCKSTPVKIVTATA